MAWLVVAGVVGALLFPYKNFLCLSFVNF